MSAVDAGLARAEDDLNTVHQMHLMIRRRMRAGQLEDLHTFTARLLAQAEALHDGATQVAALEQWNDLRAQNLSEDAIRDRMGDLYDNLEEAA
ncbi:hypothetical protein ACFP47_10350 [Nesterenkonia lacusekhoensis]|uniref:Uncharacterized protein n=1 Tax=Nesterenkonia lacusekhoensis TaxID=150832 RepID=A0ABS4T559_9MICC|nr:hypothetical protein [Nesterenkonia lacusekhoensis]MBP2319602.1 hypothetical protein [Nesterenkonia lacusekhoensis]